MNVITEQEKQQLIEGSRALAKADRRHLPRSPVVSMKDFLQNVEQLSQILPSLPRSFAQGKHWKL